MEPWNCGWPSFPDALVNLWTARWGPSRNFGRRGFSEVRVNASRPSWWRKMFVISSTAETIHPTDTVEAGADGVIDKMDTTGEVFAAIRR
jgi:hypothetical protein